MAGEAAESQTVLVVGGGIAGITAAVEVIETGYDVVLVEKSPTLGGRVAQLNRYFPKLCHPTCGLEINYQRLRSNPRIRVLTMATVAAVSGSRGRFGVTIETRPRHVNANCTACGDCAKAATTRVPNAYNYGLDTVPAAHLPHAMAYPMRYVLAPEVIGTPEADAIRAACKYGAIDLEEKPRRFDLAVGAIVWAAGWKPYDAAKLQSYGHGRVPNVINNVEMERLAAFTGPTGGKILRPSDGKPAKRVALIQCAGSRDHNHLPYCSRICCLGSLKHAAYVREQYADGQVDIYYIDIRAHDKLEAFYRRVAADPQVRFVKSKPASITADDAGNPVLHGEDTVSREIYDRPYDLVVLATGMEPSLAGALPAKLAVDDYGFLVPELDPGSGMFAAGVAQGPLDVSMSVQSATAAALKAIQAIRGAGGHAAAGRA
ncbi:MAG: CoB--CoM heterodisulfide reductase iron-sulfur subunit A family protein [Alphaproteobacteria bacterium]|nr:CoB--CoM heterodisulfide reductase iron-sulfur subunit A family protein [Alphaproteobacteria bacterium]